MAKEKWSYWRLMNRAGLTIGFMRQHRSRIEYVDLRGESWQREAIEYADRVRLDEALPGFRFLKGANDGK
jgi:hypothetical protein